MKNEIDKRFKNVRCIFLDIDNTLTNSDLNITEYTSKILKQVKDKGIYIILCTGRTNQYAVEKSKLCNGSSLVISDNGTLIYDYMLDKIYYENVISKDILKNFLQLSINYNVDCVFNTVYSRYRHYRYADNNYIKKANLISDIDDIKENVTQIVINSEEYKNIKLYSDEILKIQELDITNTNLNSKPENNSYFCDINVHGCSKGIAIEKFLELFNIKKSETMCFGDSMNDYSMFEVCEFGVAMKNADVVLKEKACCITEYDNNEDGVAKFLEKYFLE